jgi:rRNA maturation endonuclease Nob1
MTRHSSQRRMDRTARVQGRREAKRLAMAPTTANSGLNERLWYHRCQGGRVITFLGLEVLVCQRCGLELEQVRAKIESRRESAV